MPSTEPSTRTRDLTRLLRDAAKGDRRAFDHVFSLVYAELLRIARSQRGRWDGDRTLNTTALVHEAYLRLVGWDGADWKDRRHFFAVAARAMRQVLVNHAERRRALKRGGDRTAVPLAAVAERLSSVSDDAADEVLALNGALERLEEVAPRQCRVVECRFFAGLSIEETAEAVGISPATVKRDWSLASAWLYRELADDP